MVPLGSVVEDNVTGVRGVAVSRAILFNGCVRIGVQPEVGPDGKLPEVLALDEQRTVVVGQSSVVAVPPSEPFPVIGTRMRGRIVPLLEGTIVGHLVTISGEISVLLSRHGRGSDAEKWFHLPYLEPMETVSE